MPDRLRITSTITNTKSNWVSSSILIGISLILGCIGMAVFAMSARTKAWSAKTVMSQQSSSATAGTPHRIKLGAELITIIPQGFMPAEITHPKGPFFLVVDNRSGLASISLRLSQETGQHLREVLAGPERLNWSEVVDLPPGRYVLSEASHSTWVCPITITPQ